MPTRPINVLVVEDSAVARALLIHTLTADPTIKVTGCAADGEEAIAMLKRNKPDVVTMDIHMPKLDGFETTRRIMETEPLPIVIVSSSYNSADVQMTFQALDAGAVAAVEKPPGIGDPMYAKLARKLVETVKAMAEVRVVKRWTRARRAAQREPAPPLRASEIKPPDDRIKIVAMGASTGGPPVLHTILAALPKPFPVPILIVQHISAGFVQGLADWLEQTAALPVRIARHGEQPQPGTAYLAPDGCHMRVDADERLTCVEGERENGLRPAVSCLFRSVAEVFGTRAVGVLLTGMGKDGAQELKLMRDRGGVTIAQDKESSVIHGMPGEAVRLGAAAYVFPPEQIAATLQALVTDRLSNDAKIAR